MACLLCSAAAARASVSKRERASLALGVLGVDELDGDARPQRDVASFPHRAHAAAADEPEHLVLAGDESTGRGRLRIHPGCPLYIRRLSPAPLTRHFAHVAPALSRTPPGPKESPAAAPAEATAPSRSAPSRTAPSPAAPSATAERAARLPPPGAADVLYLVDLSGYVFRAYHALPPLSSSRGEPTHAVLGTVNMLQKVVGERRPHMLAVAMDSKGRTFRHDLDARYKATRPAPPPDLSQQMARVRGDRRTPGTPRASSKDGLEADDLIAAVTARALAEGWRVVIVSADKDMMQLVRDDDDRVVLWDSMRDRVYGPAEVRQKLGVAPEPGARFSRPHRRHQRQRPRRPRRRTEDRDRSPRPVRVARWRLRSTSTRWQGPSSARACASTRPTRASRRSS